MAAASTRRELTLHPEDHVQENDGALPEDIFDMVSLHLLQVTQAPSLKQISPRLGALVHLTTLDLSDNGLIALPAAIGELQDLKTLIVRSNKLTDLPPEIGTCK